MIRIKILLLIGVFPGLSGCYDREREERLIRREQRLLVREKQFALKEAEYLSLVKMRDSLRTLPDTVIVSPVWPEQIAGYWNSKVTCSESNCPDYVVGDQRNDTWLFSSDSTQLTTKVISNNNLIRVYNASFNDDLITMRFRTDSSASRQVIMSVTLSEISPNRIRGLRTILIDNRCTARFNVELTRAAAKEQN